MQMTKCLYETFQYIPIKRKKKQLIQLFFFIVDNKSTFISTEIVFFLLNLGLYTLINSFCLTRFSFFVFFWKAHVVT